MINCNCDGCTCGSGIQIENSNKIENESSSFNNLWKTPQIYGQRDGSINE